MLQQPTPSDLRTLTTDKDLARRARQDLIRPPPMIRAIDEWEFYEDTEDRGMLNYYEEVGNTFSYMKSIRKEMNKLKARFDEVEVRQRETLEKIETLKDVPFAPTMVDQGKVSPPRRVAGSTKGGAASARNHRPTVAGGKHKL